MAVSSSGFGLMAVGSKRKFFERTALSKKQWPQPDIRREEEDTTCEMSRVSPLEPTKDHSKAVRTEQVSDLDLITRFQEGDEEAFADLYERYHPRIFTFCLRMMSNNETLAGDAFQETFIKIYQRAEQFRMGTNVIGWMLMVARNTCLNMLRAQKPNDSLDNHVGLVSQDRTMDPEFGHEQKFLKELLETAIGNLPVEIREPLILREFDGFSYSEIAKQLSITLGATKQRIYRAKQALRKELWPYIKEGTLYGALAEGSGILGGEESDD